MLDWLIIGGGIQGCTMASYLRLKKKVASDKVAIIDPHPAPLARWTQCTSIISMPYLRSPSIHHLEPEPFALEKYAKEKKKKEFLVAPYDRPNISLFNEHCEHVFQQIQINKSWVQGRVKRLQKQNLHWKISLENGEEFKSKNVVIAIGLSDHPYWPQWAAQLKNDGASVFHVFEDSPKKLQSTREVTIIGGGISAAHLAMKWGNLIPGQVTLLTRHPLRVHQFDSDPGWLGPKYMRDFSKVTNYEQRRDIIKKARHRGSLPLELKTRLLQAERERKISIQIDEVIDAKTTHNEIELSLTSKATKKTNAILLATGFHQTIPGIEWIHPIVETEGLRCAKCGYPIIGPDLQWDRGLFVLGPLAELEIGPVARNIAGARRGAERIIAAVE
ncbi:NAD(P)-binding domain-containing protein [Alkalihalobacterium alkalicellulosilyticum]|uniref:NAD(P)-binding domain-containing protein n=1 Tax=Alkalihalobacterium alkalicellulosilyticum TaxID=1912214 RepID=UPI000996DD26|nr:FAD/NAD(P)-binding protein [Bacillus alkalicellulosilyticus]